MRDESQPETMEKGREIGKARSESDIHTLCSELERVKRQNADLLAALKEIDAIATGKQAKAIIRAQQVARAAVVDATLNADFPLQSFYQKEEG